MRLRSVAGLLAWLALACATAHEPVKPVVQPAAATSVHTRPATTARPEAAPQTSRGGEALGSTEATEPKSEASAAELEPPDPGTLSELGAAAFSGDEQKVDALLARGVEVNQRDRHGATALTLALSNYQDEPKCCEHAARRRLEQMQQRSQRKLRIARTLIEHGADVTRSDGLDLTPLHHAVMAYGPDPEVIAVMEDLISYGADVNRRTEPYGRSALEWAIGKSPERVACLLRNGADPAIVTHEGKTLLQVAEAQGDARTIEQLRAALAVRPRQ